MHDWKQDWIETNNRAMRRERITLWLKICAWAIALICASLLMLIITLSALARASEAAQLAPRVMMF